MKYKDIFLDFDDTLYDTRNNAILALRELYEIFRFNELLCSEERFNELYWAANMELWGQYNKGEIKRDYLIIERFRRPLLATAIDDGSWVTKEFCLRVCDKFLELCSTKPGVIQGAHELMDHLRRKGYRTHICSNGFQEIQYKKLRACGLLHFFDTIILSEDAGFNKPFPQFFDYAINATGAERETTLMIGDNYNADILGALDSGIDAMLFQRWDPSFVPPRKVNYIVKTLYDIISIL